MLIHRAALRCFHAVDRSSASIIVWLDFFGVNVCRSFKPESFFKAYIVHKTCKSKHQIDRKTYPKRGYNTIPIFGSVTFPRNYTVVHLFLIINIDDFRGNSKYLQYSVHSALIIESRQKRFVMNLQLRQCFTKAKPFQLKKARFCLALFYFQKSQSIQKRQNFKIWLQTSQIGNPVLFLDMSSRLVCC